ncbi:uncharacterized protein LOC143174715 isoform X2 [Nomia melanderi]|uniref:uncharacterized protein LOC143174715 isoform X2 n=1 Tax=Nomia melanderi TaxID=2448451 RepID=UPI003FCE42FF
MFPKRRTPYRIDRRGTYLPNCVRDSLRIAYQRTIKLQRRNRSEKFGKLPLLGKNGESEQDRTGEPVEDAFDPVSPSHGGGTVTSNRYCG